MKDNIRVRLANSLSDDHLNDLLNDIRLLREELLSNSSGCSENHFSSVSFKIDNLNKLLEEFWDTRTEI